MRINKVISTVLLSSALVVGAAACGTAEAEDCDPRPGLVGGRVVFGQPELRTTSV